MLEALEPLLNSDVVNGDTKKAIEEAWESKLKETRDTIEIKWSKRDWLKRSQNSKKTNSFLRRNV